jgi:hypothetical protein
LEWRVLERSEIMMFTVTYRGKDGATCTELVEAVGRSDCLAQMKARGITPISVREGNHMSRGANGGKAVQRVAGGGRPGARAQGKLGTKSVAAKVVLVTVLVAVGIAVWWKSKRDEKPVVTERPITTERPAKEKVKVPSGNKAVPAATNAVAKVATTNEVVTVEEKKPKERHDTVSIHTNKLGKVVEKWIGADGKLHMSVRYARKPVFDNASDDQLAMAMAGNGTQSIAPIPMTATSEQEFLESLKKPIVINDDDPENIKQIKTAVSEARAEMKRMIDNGMSYREALAEHQRLMNENVDTRNQCMAELKSLVDAGDREGAEHYLKTMNIALGQMGIPALTMPMSREELNAARKRRREEKEAAKQGDK